jgi:hypothetical protein
MDTPGNFKKLMKGEQVGTIVQNWKLNNFRIWLKTYRWYTMISNLQMRNHWAT